MIASPAPDPAPLPMLRKIRLGAAIALFCTLFLPLSRCSRGSVPQPPVAGKSIGQRLFPRSDSQTTYHYAIRDLDFEGDRALGSIVNLLAFTWPMLFLLAGRKFRTSRLAWLLCLIELILSGGSIWLLGFFTALDDRLLYGAYIAYSAAGVYGCTALFSLFLVIRAAISRRRNLQQPPIGTP